MAPNDLTPLLASAVQAWQELGLEVGETALVAGEGALADVFCLAALWHGACPVITLGAAAGRIEGVMGWNVPADDPEPALEELAQLLAGAPAVAAVDLTGRAVIADMFFEVLPQYSRLLLAGDAGEPLTIDYYVNIHRKGIRVLARRVDPEAVDALMLQRALDLLSSAERAAAWLKVAGSGS